jgi:hypothetical protein
MGYYMGDYYGVGGSVYRGDPFWGFLGRLAKGVVGGLTGIGMGAGVPAAAGRASGAIAKVGGRVGGMIARHPVLSAAGAAAVLAGAGGAGIEHMAAGGAACPKGFHPCKSKHGCKKGPCVRNRHMRVTNPRALRRSIRRATGFAKLAMRTIHLVHPKKRARFGGFRKRRK